MTHMTKTTMKKKVRRVKAWAVVDLDTKKVVETWIGADRYTKATAKLRSITIVKVAGLYRRVIVVSCTITYTLPNLKKL